MGKSRGKKHNAAIFKKLALFYQGIQTLQKITNNGFTFPRTFVQDCRFYFSKELNISLIEVKIGWSSKNEFYGYSRVTETYSFVVTRAGR